MLAGMDTHPSPRRRASLIAALAWPLVDSARAFGFATAGSGRIVHAEFDVPAFQAIELTGSTAVTLVQSRTLRVSVDVDDNLQALFEPRVRDGTLSLHFRESVQATKLRIVVSVWALEQVTLGGSASLQSELLVAKHLTLRAGGSGVIRLPDLTAERVDVQLSGSANARLAGQANELALSLGGSGTLDASALQVRRAVAEMGGSSHARVFASERLGGSIGGSSQLRYRGEARVNVARGGSARVEPID
jgi:hypothetical protein